MLQGNLKETFLRACLYCYTRDIKEVFPFLFKIFVASFK